MSLIHQAAYPLVTIGVSTRPYIVKAHLRRAFIIYTPARVPAIPCQVYALFKIKKNGDSPME